jgi:Protein of unknown function (DUF3038)
MFSTASIFMLSIQMMPASTPKLDDLLVTSKLDSAQLNKITTELDLVAIAIVALTRVDRVKMQQTAQDLHLESIVSDWLNEWSLGRSIAGKQLDVQQLRALVLIINHLAREYQPLVRQNIIYWQQTIQSNLLPLQSPSLADYIGNFITTYQTRLGRETHQSFEALSDAALNLLIDLLFYSSPTGHQRLWSALLQRSHSRVVPPSSI